MIRLNELFPDWSTGKGVFSALGSLDVPWKGSVDSIFLDMEYHGNRSGCKGVSPLLVKLQDDKILTDEQVLNVAKTIFTMFRVSWQKEWDALTLEYQPIENYRMVEEMKDDDTIFKYGKMVTSKEDSTHDKTGSDTTSLNKNDARTLDRTTTGTGEQDTSQDTTNNIYGFNSAEAVNTGGQAQTQKATDNQSGTQNDKETVDSISDGKTVYDTTDTDTRNSSVTDSGEDSTTHSYTLTRSGNIGVTTSQQMLKSEFELWLWNYFYDVVFPAVDKVLTVKIY